MLKLSVLDQSPVRQGVTLRDARLETIELVDEVVVLTICHDFAARKRPDALLAEALALQKPA